MNRFLFILIFFCLVFLIPVKAFVFPADNEGVVKTAAITERVLVNTDRKLYVAGENIMYSLFLFDTQTKTLVSYPSIGYILVRNQTGTVIGKSQIKIRNGRANGFVNLSDTLTSGYYQVMAYTNFMRNGSPDILFHDQIMVVNRFDNDLFNLVTSSSQPLQKESAVENGFHINYRSVGEFYQVVSSIVNFDTLKPTFIAATSDNSAIYLNTIKQAQDTFLVNKNLFKGKTNSFGILDNSNNKVLQVIIPLNIEENTKIEITPNQLKYKKREKISVELNLNDKSLKYVDISFSVIENNPLEEANKLTSAFFEKNGFDYNIKFQSEDGKPLFLAEDKTAELIGRLLEKPKGYGVAYHSLYLTSPDTVSNFQHAISDAEGYFRFQLSDYYNGKDLFIKVGLSENEPGPFYIELDSKFNCSEVFKPTTWKIDSSLIGYIHRSQDIIRVQKSYGLVSSVFQPVKYKSVIPQLIQIPNYQIFPADYTELKDFQEISREIVPMLKVRKHDNNYSMEILDMQEKEYLRGNSMILLDGVMIDDINQIIPLGSRDIRRIDLVSTKWYVDFLKIPGILSVTSRNQAWKNISLNSNNIRLKAENYYEAPRLILPNYSIINSNSREPDFRQLLFWKPEMHIVGGKSEKLEFYSSDYAASYIIKVEGITNTGDKVVSYRNIEVED